MKIKTSELDGENLGYAVALIEYPEWKEQGYLESIHDLILNDLKFDDGEHYAPWKNWHQGGPIVDREICELIKCGEPTYWEARAGFEGESGHAIATGPTPLIAACRCYVASKLGDEVEIPEELLK